MTSIERCVFCEAISAMIKTPRRRHFSKYINTTEAGDPFSWHCHIHQPLLCAISSVVDEEKVDFDREKLRLEHDKKLSTFTIRNPDRNVPNTFELVRREDVPGHYGKGKIVQDTEWIDLATITGFLENCKANHGDLCDKFPWGDATDGELPRPAYLIDVQDACLVDASNENVSGAEYVTLSYNGGDGGYMAITKESLESLKTPGLFDTSVFASKLPRTFNDAFHLTRIVGFRYLWIDLICIVQDDVEHRNTEMSKAAYICCGAAFCIAECDGKDANHGIKGIHELPNPQLRSFQQTLYPVAHGEVFFRSASTFENGNEELLQLAGVKPRDTYSWQAWPRVQNIFSRRTLRFEQGTCSLACNSYAWWEGNASKNEYMWEDKAHSCDARRFGCQMGRLRAVDDFDDWEEGDYKRLPHGHKAHWSFTFVKKWPAVREYYEALEGITRLVAPEPTRMFDITAGVREAFSLQFDGRVIAGLPETCFDTFMLWKNEIRGSKRIPEMPSWSWAGWTGALARSPFMYGLDHVVSRHNLGGAIEIIPTVDWSIGEIPSLDADTRQSVDCRKWVNAKQAFHDDTKAAPPGWSRVDVKPGFFGAQTPPRGYNNQTAFRHKLAPDKAFWYPMPMVNSDAGLFKFPIPGSKQVLPCYLFGSTEHCGLYIHREDWYGRSTDKDAIDTVGRSRGPGPGRHVLRDEAGKIAGRLDAQADMAEALHGGAARERTEVELVAVSRGQTRQDSYALPELNWQLGGRAWYES